MERASFGFPNDRIEIKHVHAGDDGGREGDVLHPDEYIKKITHLYRHSWVIPPIQQTIDLVRRHENILRDIKRLIDAVQAMNTEEVARQLETMAYQIKSIMADNTQPAE